MYPSLLLVMRFWQKTFYWDQSYSSFHIWVGVFVVGLSFGFFVCFVLAYQVSMPLVSQFLLNHSHPVGRDL